MSPRAEAAHERRISDAIAYLGIAGSHGVRVCDLDRVLRCTRKTTLRTLRAIDAVLYGTTRERRAVRP